MDAWPWRGGGQELMAEPRQGCAGTRFKSGRFLAGESMGTSTYICIYVHLCMCSVLYIYIYTYVHTSAYVYTHIYICTHTNSCMYVYMYVHINTNSHTYVCIHTSRTGIIITIMIEMRGLL